MGYKNKESNNLSYSEWFSFYLSLFNNNIGLAQLYAEKAYLNQEVENDIEEISDDIEFEEIEE